VIEYKYAYLIKYPSDRELTFTSKYDQN